MNIIIAVPIIVNLSSSDRNLIKYFIKINISTKEVANVNSWEKGNLNDPKTITRKTKQMLTKNILKSSLSFFAESIGSSFKVLLNVFANKIPLTDIKGINNAKK